MNRIEELEEEVSRLQKRIGELDDLVGDIREVAAAEHARAAELEEALDRDMETLAIAIYEACRQEAADSRRPIVPESWDERDSRFREQFFSTIRRICSPGYATTPEAEHDSWMRAYEEMGWTYGPVRDAVAKTHPDMVPFDDLPESERHKDAIFLACCSVARAALEGEYERKRA